MVDGTKKVWKVSIQHIQQVLCAEAAYERQFGIDKLKAYDPPIIDVPSKRSGQKKRKSIVNVIVQHRPPSERSAVEEVIEERAAAQRQHPFPLT